MMTFGCVIFFRSEDQMQRLGRESCNRRAGLESGEEEDSGLEANGWSLPPRIHISSTDPHQSSAPIPVYCRPVTDDPSVQVGQPLLQSCSEVFTV